LADALLLVRYAPDGVGTPDPKESPISALVGKSGFGMLRAKPDDPLHVEQMVTGFVGAVKTQVWQHVRRGS
jgi:hypothetical protein